MHEKIKLKTNKNYCLLFYFAHCIFTIRLGNAELVI